MLIAGNRRKRRNAKEAPNKLSKKPLCIHHFPCADGFGAAWVFRHARPEQFEYHAGVYQNSPPNVEGRDVYLVDFSYKRQVVERILQRANSVTLIDHHRSAIEDLKPLIESKRIKALVDMNHSGAVLAWKWFYGDEGDMPPLLRYVEDRDLWKYALPYSREVNMNVFSHPYDFDVWDGMMFENIEGLIEAGVHIARKHDKDVDELISKCTRTMNIGGYAIPVCNVPYTMGSDVGNILATDQPFAGYYYDTPEGRVFGLRSMPSGVEVDKIAAQYGGGGHPHASGFRVPYDHELCK